MQKNSSAQKGSAVHSAKKSGATQHVQPRPNIYLFIQLLNVILIHIISIYIVK